MLGVTGLRLPDSTFATIAVLIPLFAAAIMALLVAGQLGHIVLFSAPVDRNIVISALWHSALGCALTCLQWAAGAGLVLWATQEKDPPITKLMLLGFPASLVIILVLSCLILSLPFGWIAAFGILAVCYWPLVFRPDIRKQILRPVPAILCLLPMALLFGCWLGLFAHGPSETLPGRPSGDLAFYASNIYALQLHPFSLVNFANEGEVSIPFNELYSGLGAALMQFLPLDPFQFVLAGGGSTFVLGLGLALYSYISLAPRTGTQLSYTIVALAAIVGIRYPFWVVESLPVIFTIPLTICIWYRASHTDGTAQVIKNFGFSLVSSALTKVTAIVPLGLVTLAPLLQNRMDLVREFRETPKGLRAVLAISALAAFAYVAYMTIRFAPYMISQGGFAPETLQQFGFARQFHSSLRAVIPFALRDGGTILLVFLAYRMFTWPFAAAVTIGLIAAFVFPYVLRIDLDCCLFILALRGLDRPDLLEKSKYLALAAYLLCLPAVVQTDPGHHFGSAVWIISIGGMSLTVFALSGNRVAPPDRRSAAMGSALFAVAGALMLVAFERQQISFLLRPDSMTIWPEARDIWTKVRQQTPTDALIFTDQTANPPDGELQANGTWNTYATTGQRQIYMAGWYQSPELRQSPELLARRLQENDAVLSGQLRPTDLHYRRYSYTDFFAVTQSSRSMPPSWHPIYQNGRYALYRYRPSGRAGARGP